MALDLAIYLQRVLFHAVPALWRLHRHCVRGRYDRDHMVDIHRMDDEKLATAGHAVTG